MYDMFLEKSQKKSTGQILQNNWQQINVLLLTVVAIGYFFVSLMRFALIGFFLV